MLAGLCVAPDKGSLQRWPKSALMVTQQKGGEFQVKLWEKKVQDKVWHWRFLFWRRSPMGRNFAFRARPIALYPSETGFASTFAILHRDRRPTGLSVYPRLDPMSRS
jgi:hypothetical protein